MNKFKFTIHDGPGEPPIGCLIVKACSCEQAKELAMRMTSNAYVVMYVLEGVENGKAGK